MISVYQLKPRFAALLRPVAARLAAKGYTANQITIFACVLSIAYGMILAVFHDIKLLWLGLPLFLFVRMALNAIDGILAREFAQKSNSGALLNEMGDVIADAALFVALSWIPGVTVWLVGAFIWMALLTEYAGVLAKMINAERRYDGPMGKSDRALLIGALGLWLGLWHGPQWQIQVVDGLLALASILMIWTVWNRLSRALTQVARGN